MGQASSSSSSCSCSRYEMCRHSLNTIGDLTLSLPDECLATVFGKLSCNDRNSCSLVCKRWKAIDSKSRDRLVLFSPSQISTYIPSLLSRFTFVSILSLKCSRKHLSIDDNSFSKIPNLLVSLKKLKLKGCVDVSDDGLVAFASHSNSLSKVSFASCGFGAEGLLSLLSNSPSLRHLTLKRLRNLDAQNTPIWSDYDTDTLNIQRLCLKDLHNARIFIPLLAASSKALRTLIVCRSSGNWDKVLQKTALVSLSELQIENVQMGDAALIAISSSSPHLQVLQLTRTTDCTDVGLSAVANSCKSLRKLHIDAWSRFGSRTIGVAGINAVAKNCSNLQELVLMGIPVTISAFTLLATNCSSLERLALCNTETVGDSEMAVIAQKFSALKKLCIKNCPISDKGIEAIADGCPNLVKLKVKRCRGISEASGSVRRVRMKRSWVVVSVDSESMMINAQQQQQSLNTTASNTATTHVVCSSNTFQTALQIAKLHLRRRPN